MPELGHSRDPIVTIPLWNRRDWEEGNASLSCRSTVGPTQLLLQLRTGLLRAAELSTARGAQAAPHLLDPAFL